MSDPVDAAMSEAAWAARARRREGRHRAKSEVHRREHVRLREAALKESTQLRRDTLLGLADIEACEARRNKQWADACALIAERLEEEPP